MRFDEHPSGLFMYSPKSKTSSAYTLLNTVADNKAIYTKRQITQADDARRLYRLLGRPDESVFHTALRDNYFINCPITVDDAVRATSIYGPDVSTLKGKTTRATAAPRAPGFAPCALPPGFLDAHSRVTLCADFFFVQQSCFLHTISRDLQFRTVSPVPDRSRPTIIKEFRAVRDLYAARGFVLTSIHGDSEFDCVKHNFPDINFNIVAADGHVGEVERSIRTIKERFRALVHGLPFRRVPKLFIQRATIDVNRLLNLFPSANGASSTLSPSSIVTGQPRPDISKFRLEFGEYVQVFDDFEPTNTPHARTMGAIALDPCGNAQGAYNFLSLATGALISRHRWTPLPLNDLAISRVEALAARDGQPLLQARNLVAEGDPNHVVDSDTYDFDYALPKVPPNDSPLDDSYDPIDASELSDLILPFAADEIPQPQGANITDEEDDDDTDNDYVADDNDDDNNNDDTNINPADDGVSIQPEQVQDNDGYNLRSRSTQQPNPMVFRSAMDDPHNNQSYYPPRVNHLQHFQYLPPKTMSVNKSLQHEALPKVALDDRQEFATNFVFTHIKQNMEADAGIKKTQMSFREGVRRYGKAAEEALMKEFAQLEDLNVYEAVNARLLTHEQRKGALRAINLIKEKRTGQIKGRTVADGRIQRSLYDKSETASPTVATDALMLSIIIDAYEGRDVATADIAGAYLKAYMKDFVLKKFSGDTVRILCEMNPKHKPFVVIENGQEVLYVRLIKAIYGCVKSALLWYELFSSTLTTMGFKLNPYDQCVANCDINGKQCTIAWYVDDTKISHEDPEVVSDIIRQLEAHFGTMSVTRGDQHVFLGMSITYNRANRTANISMMEYLKEAIAESGLAITKAYSTPANKDLFTISASSPFLHQSEQEVFHSVVAKLLYVSIRARMDLLLATSFLATRVSKSTQQDLDKLQRLLEYIFGSLNDTLTLGADSLTQFRTWVDASYAIHPDCRSHTGGAISFGTGTIICKSTKQKLNTKSSTEAETVGTSDYLPNAIWVKMFMTAQGYHMDTTILEQDNESAIKLTTNGRASAGPKSRHIDIRYFWLKDRIGTGDITIRHCPTHQMLADFLTKPLQGSFFRRFKAVVLGYLHVSSLQTIIASSLEERVEKDDRSNSIDSFVSEGLDRDCKKRVRFTPDTHVHTYAEIVKRTSVTDAAGAGVKQKNLVYG
jgi:hypothetical protein